MRLAVVIPVYNEQDTLPDLFARLAATVPPEDPDGSGRLDRRIILVDDGSHDETAHVVRTLAERDDVLAVYHKENRRKL